jgi:hypothetical protein
MGLFNATVQFIEPVRAGAGTGGLEREYTYREHEAERASLRQLSASAAQSALGQASLKAYSLRCTTLLRVEPGWRVKARIDGDDFWATYEVTACTTAYHKRILVERV